MDYYKILNFEMEPFSSSPDPGLFYNSAQHLEALQKLEIAIRLKRGLNIITGDIGTGKTTLSRQLIQKISNDESIKYYLVLDPGFRNTVSFLKYLLFLFQPETKYETDDENILKENIKKHLFSYGIKKQINIVLIIDEGQKLSLACIEVLRELLNFETNDQKLLQIIILAQKELDHSLSQVKNFKDRINFYYRLDPLNFRESKRLIDFRLKKSFIKGKNKTLFTPLGYYLIYRATKGFPRKIVTLCHQIMLSLIIKNKSKASFLFVRACINKGFSEKRVIKPGFLLAFLFILSIGPFYFLNNNKIPQIPDLFSYFNKSPIETQKLKSLVKENKSSDKPKNVNFKQTQIKTDIKPIISVENKDALLITGLNTKIRKENKTSQLKKPDSFGSIKVPENTTLARMMRIIYGSFRYSYLDKLIKHNLNLKDPNNIEAGMKINFPVIQSPDSLDDKKIFIVLFETNNFKNSFIIAHNYQATDFNVRILPVWRENIGFFFPVVINKPFVSMKTANRYKNSRPEIIFAKCKPISQMKKTGNK